MTNRNRKPINEDTMESIRHIAESDMKTAKYAKALLETIEGDGLPEEDCES